jgi:diaminohydroxyphosphoribosylaminopyrimidine deaminase/5-amino-6-(5-phosphoribosylamino)uracil reductase
VDDRGDAPQHERFAPVTFAPMTSDDFRRGRFDATDAAWLRHALELAQRSIGLSEPNPRVGCVITTPGHETVATGFTQEAGGPHAEVVALRAAQAQGLSLQGATAYVTLEPCAHHGRTPPCCDALIAAGVGRVVVAVGDPFPQVAGQGLARLRAAGVEVVECPDAAIVAAARELNIGFFSRVLRRRPWVRLKAAVSVDGRTALPDGASQWITGEAARADGHAWRRRAGAVLTGVGTVLEDDPRLDVRAVPTARQPRRVIVDSRLDTPPGARILDAPGEVCVVHAQPADALVAAAATPMARAAAALAGRGARLASLPGPNGKVDLAGLLERLADEGVNELHVEAGHRLNGSFLREGLVDECLVYVAPALLGEGRPLAAFGPLASLGDAPRGRFVSVDPVGSDLRLVLRLPGREPWPVG